MIAKNLRAWLRLDDNNTEANTLKRGLTVKFGQQNFASQKGFL